MTTADPVIQALSGISTASITTILLKKGLRNVWMRGPRPLRSEPARLFGRAFTLPAGCIAVVDARGITDAGIFGDILCGRMHQRGVTALVTDGVVRDRAGVLETRLPVWCRGAAAPPSVAGLTFVGWQEPIGCGGVAVFPDDVVVADGDGAVVIPQAMLEEVVSLGIEQERLETWIMKQVESGHRLPGLYPPDDATIKFIARERGWLKEDI